MTHLHTFVLAITFISLNGIHGVPESCKISLPGGIPQHGEPVYLRTTKNGSLRALQPTGHTTSIPIGESVSIFCPNDEQKIQKVTCGRNFDLTKYICTGSTTTETIETLEECGGSGKWYKIGITLPKGDFHTIYRTCFDRKHLTPIYSFHILNGKAVGYHVKHIRGSFRTTKGVYGKVRIDNLYKTHISRFKKVFGSTQTFFRKPLFFLSRGHLSPEVDFTFGTEQHATEIYLNTAPQYQTINQGSWLNVEKHVRNLAGILQENLPVVTGILGLLHLKNKRTEQDIYLGDGVVPVPEIFWKAVFNPKTFEAIVFVGSNNPHTKTFNPGCQDVCDAAGYGDSQHPKQKFDNPSSGLTICCKLMEFIEKSNVILPEELNYKKYNKILKLPKSSGNKENSAKRG
uniref:43.7 kDa salivary protein n=1 Tax=Nyssomyia intermedia TaxID=182990 RepID=J7HBS9_9DIPT